jgi:hypothetical protein
MISRVWSVILLLAMGARVACGDSVVLKPVADTTLIEAKPDNNLGGQYFANAGTTQNYTRNRALFQFDPAAAIPAGAVVSSATLILEVIRQPPESVPSQFGLHRVLRPWGEGNKFALDGASPGLGAAATAGEATWNDRFAFASSPWAQPGGAAGIDYAPETSSQTYVYGTAESPYVFESDTPTVQDVQYWLDHPESNFGWMLMSQSESDNFTARRFASREDPDHEPLLYVDFTVVPEPGPMALGGTGAVFFLAYVRWKRPHSPGPRIDLQKTT